MRKLFQKFRKDCKGAVTVLVTLLLIPSVLISGTGVDLARTYAAKSLLQDANQLAANSVLASYDALLQDLYGLFGVMADDPEFAAMVDEYIKVSVLGEDWKDTGMGTFQLYYGADPQPGDVTPEKGQNLKNPDVLRRQIEEYAKFRAPAIIVEDILERLETFENVKKDAKIIDEKTDIDDGIEEIQKIYKKIYECIKNVNTAQSVEEAAFKKVNESLKGTKNSDGIEDVIDALWETRDDYQNATNEDYKADYETKYKGLIKNLNALIKGGIYREGFHLGNYDSEGNYVPGYWTDESTKIKGIEKTVDEYVSNLKKYLDDGLFDGDSDLEDLLNLCKKAQRKKAELESKINSLEQKLNNNECSEQLKNGLTEPQASGKPLLDEYRDLLKYDVEKMGQAMYDLDTAQLRQTITALEDLKDTFYISSAVAQPKSMRYFKDISINGLPLELLETEYDELSYLDSISPDKHSIPGTFRKFQYKNFNNGENEAFYKELEKLFADSGKEIKKKNYVKGIEACMASIQNQFVSFLTFDPEGAYKYTKTASSGDSSDSTNFGQDTDWSKSGAAKSEVKSAMNSSLLSDLGKAADSAANKILILTYATEMFSCYSTNRGLEEGETPEINMNGIPYGVGVNYFYQSELEYIFNGNGTDAIKNLMAVTSMIFLVRFVFNYIASFMLDCVKTPVNSVKNAFAAAGLGPVGVVVGELLRLTLALGESVCDVGRLKEGAQVAIFKMEDEQWGFKLGGDFLSSLENGELPSLSFGMFSGESSNDDDDTFARMSYKDYLRLFLLLKDGDLIAQRVAYLIELNVTNYREGIGAKESRNDRQTAMSNAALFDMSKAITGFSLTTTAEMKMLFLSMPFAQKGVNGVIPPGTLMISATDYRGY